MIEGDARAEARHALVTRRRLPHDQGGGKRVGTPPRDGNVMTQDEDRKQAAREPACALGVPYAVAARRLADPRRAEATVAREEKCWRIIRTVAATRSRGGSPSCGTTGTPSSSKKWPGTPIATASRKVVADRVGLKQPAQDRRGHRVIMAG
jgi:hypothetical protein